MMIPHYQSTLKLTHYGRKTANVYHVTIWFVEIDDELWIGSLDENRSWVRNLRATGRGAVDFGEGANNVSVEPITQADLQRFRDAVAKKYPMLSRLIGLFVRGKTQAAFRVRVAPNKGD
ncbi:MAG TPA: nitroreductase/quinone reductase family protein [Candidatus Binatia bacterium]|jgi:deazaflavin-dependent oxidoreductase (nitroreductase family)